nr:hypothetical protein [Tanacetum cinerariifolium]
MMLTTKDDGRVNLDTEENDFVLIDAYGDDQLKELNASVIMMARIQPTDKKSNIELTYDVEVISEDQIDSDITFDDPYVEDNSGQVKHDPNAHDQTFADIESLINNVQVEVEN